MIAALLSDDLRLGQRPADRGRRRRADLGGPSMSDSAPSDKSCRSQGVYHHRPDLWHRPRAPHLRWPKHGTVVLVGRDRGKLNVGAEGQRARRRARSFGRMRPVGYRERASRGCGDRRARTFRSLGCSTTRALCNCARRRTRWVGHVVRDEPSRPVRADRSACAASPRRC